MNTIAAKACAATAAGACFPQDAESPCSTSVPAATPSDPSPPDRPSRQDGSEAPVLPRRDPKARLIRPPVDEVIAWAAHQAHARFLGATADERWQSAYRAFRRTTGSPLTYERFRRVAMAIGYAP